MALEWELRSGGELDLILIRKGGNGVWERRDGFRDGRFLGF